MNASDVDSRVLKFVADFGGRAPAGAIHGYLSGPDSRTTIQRSLDTLVAVGRLRREMVRERLAANSPHMIDFEYYRITA